MALTRNDLTASEEAEVNAVADALKAGRARMAAVDAARSALESAQAQWRADARGMTRTQYNANKATRDAAIAALHAALVAAEKE